MARTTLINGVIGQDGPNRSRVLLEMDYATDVLNRCSSCCNAEQVDVRSIYPHEREPRFLLRYSDVTESSSLVCLAQEMLPAETDNLNVQSDMQVNLDGARRWNLEYRCGE